MKVRPATVQDARVIAEIHVEAWRVAYDGVVPADVLTNQSVQRRADWWTRCLRAPAGDVVRVAVAVSSDEVVGFCAVGPSRDDDAPATVGEVHAIYVAPAIWAGGAGSALLAEGEQWLREEVGCREATLWVLQQNRKARAWYERRGWRWDHSRRQEQQGGLALTELRYRRRL